MPDMDRFERKIRGQGWRKVYRLACSGAPIGEVVDAAVRAACCILNAAPLAGMREIYGVLARALAAPLLDRATPGSGSSLADGIEAALAAHGGGELDRVAGEAALRLSETFNWAAAAPTELGAAFVQEIVFGLAQRHCLSCSAPGIMEHRGWSVEAQLSWTHALKAALAGPCAQLARRVLEPGVGPLIRAPRRTVKPVPMTIERLHQALELPPGA